MYIKKRPNEEMFQNRIKQNHLGIVASFKLFMINMCPFTDLLAFIQLIQKTFRYKEHVKKKNV